MMKRFMAFLLALALMVSLAQAALADTLGLGIVTSIGASRSATSEEDGYAQADTTVCAVMLDEEDRIVWISFDVAQTKIAINHQGQITADMAAKITTKKESADNYGMVSASVIGKEIHEQIQALEAWCIGKTVEEAVTGANAGNDADLLAGCTIHVDAFTAALAKAYANAK